MVSVSPFALRLFLSPVDRAKLIRDTMNLNIRLKGPSDVMMGLGTWVPSQHWGLMVMVVLWTMDVHGWKLRISGIEVAFFHTISTECEVKMIDHETQGVGNIQVLPHHAPLSKPSAIGALKHLEGEFPEFARSTPKQPNTKPIYRFLSELL